MANLSAAREYKAEPEAFIHEYKCNSLTYKQGSAIGVRPSTGYAVLRDGTGDDIFAGLATSGGASASTVKVNTRSQVIRCYTGSTNGASGGVNVTGASAITDTGKPVYLGDDNLENLTLTSNGSAPVGVVSKWLSGSQCWVTLTPGIADEQPLRVDDGESLKFGTGEDLLLNWNGSYMQAGPSSGLWKDCPSKIDPNYRNVAHEVDLDFHDVGTLNGNFTSVDDGGTGTNTTVDVVGGAAGIVTAAADNDYHAMVSGEAFKFAAGKKLWMEARIRLTEAATNESAWWIGFTDTTTTGGLQANAAGPLASYDGALIWKDEGTLKIDFETSNAATQNTDSEIGDFTSATWLRVGMYFDGTTTTGTIQAYIDGVAAGDAQDITLAGLEEMHFVMGVKAGPSGGAETLDVDYVKIVQLK